MYEHNSLVFSLIKAALVTTTIEYMLCQQQRPMILYHSFTETN